MYVNSLRGKSTVKASPLKRLWRSAYFLPVLWVLASGASQAADPVSSPAPDLVRKINENFRNFPGIKAYLELELSQPGISPHHSFAQLAYVAQSDQLYFKTFSPLTPHYFTLISKEGRFSLQIPKTKTIYTGPLEAIGQENFELKITPQDFRRILVPNPIEHTPDRIQVQETPLYWILTLYGEAGTQTFKERVVEFRKAGSQVAKDTRYSVNGNPYLEIQWSEFSSASAASPFPSVITLFRPSNGYLLRLNLKKWEVTDHIPPELFESGDEAAYTVERINP